MIYILPISFPAHSLGSLVRPKSALKGAWPSSRLVIQKKDTHISEKFSSVIKMGAWPESGRGLNFEAAAENTFAAFLFEKCSFCHSSKWGVTSKWAGQIKNLILIFWKRAKKGSNI